MGARYRETARRWALLLINAFFLLVPAPGKAAALEDGLTIAVDSPVNTHEYPQAFAVAERTIQPSFIISGAVFLGKEGLPGVTLRLSRSKTATAMTNARGRYSFKYLPSGRYVVTPSLSGCLFTPPKASLVITNANVTKNFTVPPLTVSGRVSSMVSGAGVENVKIRIRQAQTTSVSTYSDASGRYRFRGLANGTYVITASLKDAMFTPLKRVVTISGTSKMGQNFRALQGRIVADNVDFLPSSISSANQLRVSLVPAGDDLVFTDSSDFPLKKLSGTDLTTTSLASRFTTADSVVLHDQHVYWVMDGHLNRTALDGTTTTALGGTAITANIVVDDANIYWVDSGFIQKVPISGGAAVTLAAADRPVAALTADADHLYWEEASLDPVSPGCQCGSSIKSVPKAGGETMLLVDNRLNGTMPPPPPGHTPGSWYPTGGLAVTGTAVVFGVAGGSSYAVETVPIAGGSLTALATVSSSAGFASNSIRNLTVDGNTAYWIDSANQTLDSVPLAGGSVTVLASGLGVSVYANVYLAISGTSAFWTEPGAPSGCCLQLGEGSIKQVPLAGGIVNTVVGSLDRPAALAVDAGNLVWTEVWRVATAALGGGAPTTLASGIGGNMARIAVDQNNVYILDGDLIKTVPLAGGTVEKLASAKFGKIGDISNIPQDIATDGVSVFWTSKEIMGAPVVQKVSVAGGTPVTLATTPGIPYPQDCYWRILIDTQYVYWSSGSTQYPVGCSINKVPIAGGAVTELVDYAYLVDFTVDESSVYFSELGSYPGSIRKRPIAGGPTTPVAIGVFAWVLANDADRLYWIDFSNPSVSTVGEISKAAGTPTSAWISFPLSLTMDPLLAADGLAVDSGVIFVSEAPAGHIDVLY